MKYVVLIMLFTTQVFACVKKNNNIIDIKNISDKIEEQNLQKDKEEYNKQYNNSIKLTKAEKLDYSDYLEIQGKHLAHDKCISCNYKWSDQEDPNIY